jgi:hypothetical protein
MHAKKFSELNDNRSSADRAQAFLRSWQETPPGGHIDFRVGFTSRGDAAIVITIGSLDHALTVREARVVADIIADAITKFPVESDGNGFAEMRSSILDVCKIAEADNGQAQTGR